MSDRTNTRFAWLKHAFAIEKGESCDPTPEQRTIVDRLATEVVARGMAVPAIAFLEMSQPLNVVGAQAIHFFQPFFTVFTDSQSPTRFAEFLEHRGAIDFLCRRIEAVQDAAGKS